MEIFISWHGPVSRSVAGALHDWLPCVIQDAHPFLSSEDIHKGDVWFGEISAKLDSSKIGILCLTPENLDAPWIHFEAGALSKQVGQKRVVPFLLGIGPAALKPPLSNFQGVTPMKQDMMRLMHTLNDALGDKRLSDDRLQKTFEVWWPQLESKINVAEDLLQKGGGAAAAKRSQEDILLELLELVRGLAQRSSLHLGVSGASLPEPDLQSIWRGLKGDEEVKQRLKRRLDEVFARGTIAAAASKTSEPSEKE